MSLQNWEQGKEFSKASALGWRLNSVTFLGSSPLPDLSPVLFHCIGCIMLLRGFYFFIQLFKLPLAFLGFPDSSVGKESACNAGDLGLILGLGRSPGEGKGYPLQFSGLENSMDCIVDRLTKSPDAADWLSLLLFTFSEKVCLDCLFWQYQKPEMFSIS